MQQDGKQFQPQLDRLQSLYDGLDRPYRADRGQRRAWLPDPDDRYRLRPHQAIHEAGLQKNFAALEEDNPTLFKQFFPAGRSEYSSASRKGMGTAFARFVATLSEHKADVTDGAKLLKAAQPLAEQYTLARQAQDARKQ